MMTKEAPGLGELLRYLTELVEQGAEEGYRDIGLDYRPRYTPVLRALLTGADTITEITATSHLTQGAISQTVGLMVADGLVTREDVPDGRKSRLRLTAKGRKLVEQLVPHWKLTFAAIGELEREIGHPLLQVLVDAAGALERKRFAERLRAVQSP